MMKKEEKEQKKAKKSIFYSELTPLTRDIT